MTNERIIRHTGLINKVTFEIELYRVKDVHLFEPFLDRMFKRGNIRLASSQETVGIFMLSAVSNAKQLRETIRKLVEKRRAEKGVSEYDSFRERL